MTHCVGSGTRSESRSVSFISNWIDLRINKPNSKPSVLSTSIIQQYVDNGSVDAGQVAKQGQRVFFLPEFPRFSATSTAENSVF